jgi:hypothetical protein
LGDSIWTLLRARRNGLISAKVLQKMMALTAIPPNGAVISSNASAKEFTWCYVPESVGYVLDWLLSFCSTAAVYG